MKTFLRNTSVRTKLTAVIMLVSTFGLLLTSGLFVSAEVYSYRTSLERETATLASTLAANCKQLLLTNRFKAADAVLASLQLKPNIKAAYLFDKNGKPVAEYLDQSASPFIYKAIPFDFTADRQPLWRSVGTLQLATTWNHLSLFLPIDHEGRHIGTIYLLSDLRDLYGQLSGVAFGSLLLLGLSLLCSWCLAGLLQRPVTVPLLRLVKTMQSISQRQDYSLRAEKAEQDEIGSLVDGFNRTLDQIELQQNNLAAHRDSLEQTVELRTGELRKLVGELELAKGQAEAASEAKSHFLANITHELRTPLIGVLGMNELLFKTPLDDQQKMLADTVHKSGENLLRLINDVLDFSKIEAGELKLEMHEFFLHQAVEDVTALLASRAADKGLALYVDIDRDAAWRVRGDEVRVRQILMNLIGNAIKFTDQGSVTVKVSSSQQSSNSAVFNFTVSDTGVGMDVNTQQQIFSSFFQADDTDTRKHSGTGLGLSIVSQLVELFAGTIGVDSQPGEGSHFKISFPLALLEPADFALPATLTAQTVLLHLADPTEQQLLAARLKALGLNVSTAASAADLVYQLGFAQRNGQPFALTLLAADLQLPDGQFVYSALRADSAFVALRRILLLTRNETLALQKQEQKLYQPIGWSDLHANLCRSWHELHLVETASREQEARLPQPERTLPKVLLAGGNVASRELLKLNLAGLPVCFENAGNLQQFAEQLSTQTFIAVLLDLTSLQHEPVADYCKQALNCPPIFVLYSANDSLANVEPFAAGLLEKPAPREVLLAALHPFLVATRQALPSADGGRG